MIKDIKHLNHKSAAIILNYCDLGIAYRCNLRCKMCYFWKDSPLNESNVVSIQEWMQILEEVSMLRRSGDFMINFSGAGEPFLREGFLDLIRYGRKLKLKMQVTSNGYAIDGKMALEIADSGLKFLCLSLDSLNSKTHDYLRGMEGSHTKVLNAIENMALFSKKIKIGINTVISRLNLKEIPDLVEWVQNNEKISYMNFQAVAQPFSYTGHQDERWFEAQEHRFLWPDDEELINKVMDKLIKFKGKECKVVDSTAQFNAFRRYFLSPLTFIKQNRCNLAKADILNIDPPGNISICQFVGIIGNVKTGQRLGEILSSKNVDQHKDEIIKCSRNCHLVVSCYFQDEEN
ncbi:MAG: radical SAM protein [Candidatus Omnitrophica bacterium]|nr:radical SAM protein [Candidatus Omnitrophota bacterium]MBU1925226.1 radical SAM protein [Candidatus Omnitrophota bacterium]